MLLQPEREFDDLTCPCLFLSHLIDKHRVGHCLHARPGGGRNAAEDLLDRTLQGVPNGDKIIDNDAGREDNKAG